jgi:hypothetical protein
MEVVQMAPRRVLLIVNSKSRIGAESLPAVMTALAAHGFSVLLPSEIARERSAA